MKKIIEVLEGVTFVSLFCWFMILSCIAIAVAMWLIPFGFGYEWWMIPINLVISAACGFGAWSFWDAWRDLSRSYYD